MRPAARRAFPRILATLALLAALATTLAGPATADSATAPGPPTNVTARAGDHLAEVTWDAPLPDDPTITTYTVTAAPPDTPPLTVDQAARAATVTGLTNATPYTFTVAATNPDGTSPPSEPSAPVTPAPPAPTTLTLTASTGRVLHGGSVGLTGVLRQAATPVGIGGEAVTIDQRRAGTTAWSPLATVMTAGDGTLSPAPQVTPHAHTQYRLRHPATPFYAASTSAVATVLVGVRLTARLNLASVALGRTAGISGAVVPPHTGQLIRLQHKTGSAWRTVQAKPLPATGRFGFVLRPRVTGATWWRIHQASDADHLGAISAPSRLVVYRAAITAIHADAAGDDRRNLNDEYVLVRNTGVTGIDLAGWKLDAGDPGQRFPLARYGLGPGATVRIHTGRGATRPGHLFLGSGRPIWDNQGDTATLIDPHNVAISRYRY